MPRYFSQQQDYIDTLQEVLNTALKNKEYILDKWFLAKCDFEWVHSEGERSKQVFQVRLKSYGKVWGEADDEHTAWNKAYDALEDADVLMAFQKMDKPDAE